MTHRSRIFPLLCVLALVIGCSKDNNPVTPPSDTGSDTQAPTVSIISPIANESVGRTSLSVEAQASDNKAVTKVEFYLDNIANAVATKTAAPWKATISIAGLQDGDHTVFAKAYDAAGNVATSAVVTWKRGDLVDVTAPTVSIAAPRLNEIAGPYELAVSVNADDNVGVRRVEAFLDGGTTPVATFTAFPWEGIVSIAELADGNHTVSAKAYDDAGNVGTSSAVGFAKGNPRMTLIEIVTSANCGPCAPANAFLRANTQDIATQVKLAVVKNHVWWPLSTDQLWIDSQTWSKPRTDYLFSGAGSYYAPDAWVGGVEMTSDYSTWVPQIHTDMAQSAEAKILIAKSVAGNQATITLTVTGLATSSYSDLRLQTVVTESNISYSDGNGETMHWDVMRTMLPDAQGEAVTIANGETRTFTRTLTIDPKWNASNLKVVAYLQSFGSKRVLQCARVAL
jgi:hypothetical protein